jgi:hypothetical protein
MYVCIVLRGFTDKYISRTEKLHLACVDVGKVYDFVRLDLWEAMKKWDLNGTELAECFRMNIKGRLEVENRLTE